MAKTGAQPLNQCRGIFLVMDYVPDDIKKMLDEIDPENWSEEHVKVIVYNALCCLNFLRSANIMHRDIKPQNLLMNSNCEVVLCDFGMARTLPKKEQPLLKGCHLNIVYDQDDSGEESDTADSSPIERNRSLKDDVVKRRRLSMHIQSRWYRAPEIILAQDEYDFQIDQWGLGCVLSEILLLLVSKNIDSEKQLDINDMYMFPGKSCFPLTPSETKCKDDATLTTVRNDDQLVKILSFLGKQD